MQIRFLFTIFFILFFIPLHAQLGKQKNTSKYYSFKTVYDSLEGINIYERLNFYLGGDSVRIAIKGNPAQNYWEDYYKSGAILHTGFYIEGKLRTYKNYFESGILEREFKNIDYSRNEMTLFWINGKKRSQIMYYKGQEEKTNEYYENGNPEIAEAFTKKCGYLLFRNFYYENGNPQSEFKIADKKRKKYSLKEYNENGILLNEGIMQYYLEVDNFMKEGTWLVYDEKGKLKATQQYVKNKMVEEIK